MSELAELFGDETTLYADSHDDDLAVREQLTVLHKMVLDTVRYDPVCRRPMTVPGVGLVTATAFLAQVGEVTRFPNPNRLVSYLGLNPSGSPVQRRVTASQPSPLFG
mgnify:CR=1 FL=1